MYINLELLWRAEYLSIFKMPFRVRRWAFIIFFTMLYCLMWLIVAFGWMLDHVLYPALRKQKVQEPVFVIAPPRSGTTMVQKLMALDDERLVHAKLYQTIFPAVCYQRFFKAVARIDKRIGQPLSTLIG